MADLPLQTEKPPMPEMTVETPEIKVCIELYADGTIKVGQEQDENSLDSTAMPAEEDAGLQTVDSVDAALEIARGLLQVTAPEEAESPFELGMQKAAGGPGKIPMPAAMNG